MKSKNKFAGMIMPPLMFALTACAGGNGPNDGPHQPLRTLRHQAMKPAGQDPKEPVTIEFMGHGNPNEKIFEKLIASFEEKNPHVTVKYTSVPPGEYSQKMTTLISSGKVPDVFYVGGPEFIASRKPERFSTSSPIWIRPHCLIPITYGSRRWTATALMAQGRRWRFVRTAEGCRTMVICL